jgi:hypothetical protein
MELQRMKRPLSTPNSGLVFPLLILAGLATVAAQAPQAPSANPTPQASSFPTPTNLRVLPRDLTGKQVHEIMERWKTGLGMECAACHAEDTEKVGTDGRPLLDFASDAKPQKAVARLMYNMTEEINTKYLAKIDGSGIPVTCGTCHRGHLGPVPFNDAQSQDEPPPVKRPPPADENTAQP